MSESRPPAAAHARRIAGELAELLGWDAAPVDDVRIRPSATALATWMPIADMAAAAQALIGLSADALHRARGGPAQGVTVDRREASLSMTAAAYLTLDGRRAVEWDPLTGYFRAADGWVYLHTAFAHLRDRLLGALELADDPAAVAAGLARLGAQEIEDRAAAAGACAIRRRNRREWEAHPQAVALGRQPVIALAREDGPAPRRMAAGAQPLSGVRVLDLSRVIAGPTIGRVLAEHGADVLRIAGPHLPAIRPLVIETGHAKRSAFVDLETAPGRRILAGLIAGADVLIDGYRPGALARRGFGADEVRRLNPALIHVDLSAFGWSGPWGGRRGYDTYVQAATGLSEDGDDGPRRLPCQPLDYLTGYFGAAAAMVALRRRLAEGGGFRIGLALARTAAWLWEQTDRIGPETAAPAANPEDAPEYRWQTASSFGELSSLRPAVTLSRTPPRWHRPPVPLGTDDPVWCDG